MTTATASTAVTADTGMMMTLVAVTMGGEAEDLYLGVPYSVVTAEVKRVLQDLLKEQQGRNQNIFLHT